MPVLGVSEAVVAVGVIQFIGLVFIVWALWGAVHRPHWAWQEAGKNKSFWVAVLLVGLFLPVVGVIAALICLVMVLPAVERQIKVGPRIRFPGGGVGR